MVATLILALGNPLRGDDGIGTAVLTHLASLGLPPDVVLVDGGTPGLETVLLLQGYQRAIIIDAAEMGLTPGAWRCFQQGAIARSAAGLTGTLHNAGLAEALHLGAALNILPPQIIVYGIQPQSVGWEPGLSAAAAAAVPVVARAIADSVALPATDVRTAFLPSQ